MADHDWDSQDHLSAAVDAIARERREWRAEITAWQEFRRRLRDLSEAPEGTIPRAHGRATPAGAVTTAIRAEDDQVERLQHRIRTAYSETVMATPAADEMETAPTENMAAELGPEISNAVYVSAAPPSNLLLMVDRAITDAVRRRENVVEKLNEEEASIESLGDDLATVREELSIYESIYPDVSFRGLIVYHSRLGELRGECTAIATRRQEQLHTTFPADFTRLEWNEYLYRDLETSNPILAAVLETIDRIDEFRRTLATDVAWADHDEDSSGRSQPQCAPLGTPRASDTS